jgi:hypothetical protein
MPSGGNAQNFHQFGKEGKKFPKQQLKLGLATTRIGSSGLSCYQDTVVKFLMSFIRWSKLPMHHNDSENVSDSLICDSYRVPICQGFNHGCSA